MECAWEAGGSVDCGTGPGKGYFNGGYAEGSLDARFAWGRLLTRGLQILRQFPDAHRAIKKVELVEAGPQLSQIQAKKLTDGPAPTTDPKTGAAVSLQRNDGLQIEWHGDLSIVPKGSWSFTIAHEFFDALPVNKFELTDKGWREIMVDVDQDPESSLHFRYVLAPKPTAASTMLMATERYKGFKVGDRVEVSPETYRVGNELAKRINADGGTALIIDYGYDRILNNSLRVRQVDLRKSYACR